MTARVGRSHPWSSLIRICWTGAYLWFTPLNLRSALYLTAGSSTAAMGQTGHCDQRGGSTALTACAEGFLQLSVLSPQLSKASVITASGRGCSKTRTSSKPSYWGNRGPICRDCWSLHSHSPGCWPSFFPWHPTGLLSPTQGTEHSVLSRTTGRCEHRQESLSGLISLKMSHFFSWRSTKWK